MAHRVLRQPACHRDFGGVRQNHAANSKAVIALQATISAVPHLNAITGILMDKKSQTKLQAAGWRLGDAPDFLQLTEQELMLLQIKESLSQAKPSARCERVRN